MGSDFLFFLPFIVFIAWFVVALVLYLTRDKSNAKMTIRRRIHLIVAGAVSGTFILTVLGLFILVLLAVANM
ncbi:MAG: hypothetical protein IJ195_00035 [Lachnospiraceae bacterium]|nr:hypothetical protein [Lachnospiraceae bacterium]